MCAMTEKSGACGTSDFDGNTFLKGGDENELLFISGFEIVKFTTENKFI